MKRIAKVYCTKEELLALTDGAELLEPYEAFQLVSLPAAALKRLAEKVPVEDVTSQYRITMAGKRVDTAPPRATRAGKGVAQAVGGMAAPLSRGKHHYLVQFRGPVKDQWIKEVEKVGGEIRGPYADFTLIVRMTPATLAKVSSLPCVRWTGHLSHQARLAKGVLKPGSAEMPDPAESGSRLQMGPGGVDLPGTLMVQFFDGKDLAAAKAKFRRCGATLVSSDPSGLAVIRVPESAAARKAAIEALSALHGVRLITAQVLPTTHNNVAVGFMGTARSIASTGLGLTGAGEIVAVADTGLDTGTMATLLPDFAGRVTAILSWPIDASLDDAVSNRRGDDGAADVDSGHGTHVAGSVLGGGSPGPGGAPEIRGLAPQANLVFQAVEQKLDFVSPDVAASFGNDPYQLAGLPSNLAKLFQQAYDLGARIHSDSWGGGPPGDYGVTSRQLDEFVWKHPDFCVLVAAGNEGVDSLPLDGVVDEGSVSSPGTAKNCITVGASQSERPEFVKSTFGRFWPGDFPKKPLKNQPVAGDREKMAAFSSRGPTVDGRVKPDVVAPGTFILSTRSTQLPPEKHGWEPYAPNPNYMYEGGTSMATPLAAGAVALMREFYRTQKQLASPSAALLKATLICGAKRLRLPYVPAKALVDNHQGFGRVDLDRVLAPTNDGVFGFQDVAPGLKTGQSSETLVTTVANRPLRIVLAYSDYPGRGLKNNLNLILVGPDGARRVGNASGNTLKFDTKNNVEVVEVAAPGAGNWRIQVVASNVPKGPQRFALAWLA